jgi:hypothetical protein
MWRTVIEYENVVNDANDQEGVIQVTTADVLLHPVRLRIVQAFLGDRALTTAELRELLPDVATATLYRQVSTLATAGVLEVVGERPVRGTTERTYRLRTEAAAVGPEEAAKLSPEQHQQAFLTFVAGLLTDFDRYLDRGDVDLGRDLVGYRQTAVHVTDAEFRELIAELGAVLTRWRALPPEGRTRRLVTTILLPAD